MNSFTSFGRIVNSSGKPLIILHGLFGSSRNWATIAANLSESLKTLVYTVDLRNHNLNGNIGLKGPIEGWNTFKNDLENFMEAEVKESEFNLLGHSLGGQITMKSILDRNSKLRNRLDNLMIVDVSLRHPTASGKSDHLFKLMKAMLTINKLDFKTRHEVAKQLKETESSDHVVNFLMTNLAKDENNGALKFSKLGLDEIIEAWPKLKSTWQDQINEFEPWSGKTTFIRGSESNYIDLKLGDLNTINKYFPQNRLVEIEGAGHWPHFDKQKEFIEIVTKVLSE